jgi:TRAP-type C4-dicarboxylate transport system permease small subunit
MTPGHQADADPYGSAPPVIIGLLRGIDRLGLAGGWIAAGCLVTLTLLILAEILVRLLSRVIEAVPADIPVAWEYSSYLMGASFLFGAAVTLRAGGHIRVTLVLANVPRPVQRLLEIVASAVGVALTIFLAWSLLQFALEAFERDQTSISSATPLWIPQMAVVGGAALLALQMVGRLIQALFGLKLIDERLQVSSLAE